MKSGLRRGHIGSSPRNTALILLALLSVRPAQAAEPDLLDLTGLSIEELGEIEISSVSKRAEPLNAAPAAIYVITRDDIVRAGATRIPEMLRLAPNLQVAQFSSTSYAISARGFNANFANKLLVLIDGRSVYSPIYSGVYWDVQNVVPDDIERIEVISGPGATLWGANAVNGVINIITRRSSDTQGGVLSLGAGNRELTGSLRYGGSLTEDLSYRAYVTGFKHDAVTTRAGASAGDRWSVPQGGFRFDWAPGENTFTLQGDFYEGTEHRPAPPNEVVSGANVTARWSRSLGERSNLQVQFYYDRARRLTEAPSSGFTVETYDVYLQHSLPLGRWNDIVWGGGYRVMRDDVKGNAIAFFQPASRTLHLSNGFIQDTITLSESVRLTLGLKLEDDPYSGSEILPNARLAWEINDNAMIWSAVSRAVRAPTRFDTDLVQMFGPIVFLTGNANFKSEKLIAYELGARVSPTSQTSFSLSAFYNVYDDLRTVEATPTTVFPLFWDNLMKGDVYGAEAWGSSQLTDWWRVTAGFNVLFKDLSFKPGTSGLIGVEQAGNDPDYQFSIGSSLNFAPEVTLDAQFRHVASLPNPAVPAYTELNMRLNWRVTPYLDLSIAGFNLLHARHQEARTDTMDNVVERSFVVQTRWAF